MKADDEIGPGVHQTWPMARQGVRIGWSDVPESVRARVDHVIGSPIVDTHGVVGGFSPGPAVRAELADGRTVFVKAAGTSLNPLAPAMHRREGEVLGVLPSTVPAPKLLGVVDDGDWVALIIEWVDGRMPDARRPADVARSLDLLDRVTSQSQEVKLAGIAPFAEAHPRLMGHWIRLRDDPPDGLDDWSRRNLDRLGELDALALQAAEGTHLVHIDVRTDNMVLADAGEAADVLVDWPGAALGAPWVDLVGLLPALHLDGGPPPTEVFAERAVGRAADSQAVDAYVAGLAGYFTRQSLRPPPPGLPTLRSFQAAQAAIAREWAAQRLLLR